MASRLSAPYLEIDFRGLEMFKKWGRFFLGGFVFILFVLLSGLDTTYGWEYLPKRGILKFSRMEALGYISGKEVAGVGEIISTEHEATGLVGEGEAVYINIGEESGAKEGDEYKIFRNIKLREQKNAYLVTKVGRLIIDKIDKKNSRALIVKAFMAINIGDRLAPYDRDDPQLSDEIKLKQNASSSNGRILMADEGKDFFGKGDLVYFNLDPQEDVEVGNCFVLYRKPGEGMGWLLDERRGAPKKGKKAATPEMIIRVGEMVVLSVHQKNAISLVIQSKVPMATGEKFTATAPCEWEAMQIKEPEKEIVKEEVAVATLPKEEAPLEEEKERIQEPEAKAFPEVDVLFNFDRYALTDDSREILKEKADWLEMNGDIRVLIEGHCDERGTNAYNLALGERRAAAVKRYLIQLGIDEERLSTISYGEEMPLDPSTNEAAWAINRRVHFVIE